MASTRMCFAECQRASTCGQNLKNTLTPMEIRLRHAKRGFQKSGDATASFLHVFTIEG